MKLSIVTTMYQSAPYLEEFHRRASAAAQALTPDYEIVFVNDGSPDQALEGAVDLFRRDPHVRVVDLSRNFGHHKAMMTGLAHARGELVFLIDVDLEEAPELLTEFQREMQAQKADVVFGVQSKRKGGLGERITGAIFYALFNRLSSDRIPRSLSTVRLMTRAYVDALLQYREREVFLGGLFVLAGFHQVAVTIEKGSKQKTSYSVRKRVALFVNALTSFSSTPLVYIFYLGTVVSFISGVAGLYLVIKAIWFGGYLMGWPSLMVSIWFLGGMMMFCIGIVGIYIAKIFSEAKQRPYALVRQVYEADADDRERGAGAGR